MMQQRMLPKHFKCGPLQRDKQGRTLLHCSSSILQLLPKLDVAPLRPHLLTHMVNDVLVIFTTLWLIDVLHPHRSKLRLQSLDGLVCLLPISILLQLFLRSIQKKARGSGPNRSIVLGDPNKKCLTQTQYSHSTFS